MSEINEYRQYTKPAELHKAINLLRGMLAGISTDGGMSESEAFELAHWCELHENMSDRHPFTELLPVVKQALEDGVLDEEERSDLLWLCSSFTDDAKYYDVSTSSIQFLQGLIHGILADGELSDREVASLKLWLDTNEFLQGTYPFDEIYSLVHAAYDDRKISDDERKMLTAFMGNLIEFKDSYNLNETDFAKLRSEYSVQGVCAFCPDVQFEGRIFCFTGESYRGTRSELAAKVEQLGGTFKSAVSKKTDYLVVGNAGNPCWAYACYGRKIEEAIELRRTGAKVQIINETDFWDAVMDAE